MTPRIFVGSVLVFAALLTVPAPGAWAQEQEEASLGGASDVASGTVVAVPQGGEVPPLHHIFVDNPGDEPIRVEFVADTPTGITVVPEWEEQSVAPGERAENHFGIVIASHASGEHEIVIQLVRSDIEPQPGRITNIPAVQTSFVVDVTGEAGTLTVESVSAISGEPVTGTLVVEAEVADGDYFEIARTDGSTLEEDLSPGDYRVSFRLGDRTLAETEATVTADQTTEVVLEVETVSFVVATARPTLDDGRPVVVDLTAAVNNEAETVVGQAELRTVILHEGAQVDTVLLDEVADLPVGLTEASVTYRPADGWQQGTYEFRFELATAAFTLTSPERPSLDVPPPPLLWEQPRFLLLAAVATLLVVFLLWWMTRTTVTRVRRRRRLKSGRHQSESAGQDEDDSTPVPGHPRLSEEPTVRWGPIASKEAVPTAHTPQAAGEEAEPTEGPPTGRSTSPATLIPPPPTSQHHSPSPASSSHNTGVARVAQSVRLAQRLSDQGHLAPDWSVADAAMVYWAVTSDEVQEALQSLGMNDQEYVSVISKLLHLGLLDPSSR